MVIKMKTWLEANGFKCQPDNFHTESNEYDWVAYRRIQRAHRRCETNDTKNCQLVVHPYKIQFPDDRTYEAYEVEITGECASLWFTLKAYSISRDDLQTKLDEIEDKLIKAWEALAS